MRLKEGLNEWILVAENGSGGFMSDLNFIGGNFGIYGEKSLLNDFQI
jgi:hypothetical protein